MHNIMPLSGPGHKSCYKSCHSLSHTVSQQVNEPPTLQTLVVQSLIYIAKSHMIIVMYRIKGIYNDTPKTQNFMIVSFCLVSKSFLSNSFLMV